MKVKNIILFVLVALLLMIFTYLLLDIREFHKQSVLSYLLLGGIGLSIWWMLKLFRAMTQA